MERQNRGLMPFTDPSSSMVKCYLKRRMKDKNQVQRSLPRFTLWNKSRRAMDARIRISLLSFLNNIKGLWDANWRAANDQDQVQRSVPRFILWNKNRRAMDARIQIICNHL